MLHSKSVNFMNYRDEYCVFVAAGHFADALISNKWSVLSVRRLMTTVGLLGPGIFLLFFSAVRNLVLAVM